MKQISILGCGWLGLPLAKALLEKGYSVKGSTTSAEKRATLESVGITPFLLELDSESIPEGFPIFLTGSDTLIIAIPPKLRGKNKDYSGAIPNSFVKKINLLLPIIENSSVRNVLFISSTAVYGETNTNITEETTPVPVTESGKQLVKTEQLLLGNPNFKTTVLRFGGLIGEDRNPVKFLAGRENIDNPEAPINLIHQKDCIGIILKIIEKECWGETFNAAAPFHPSREDYYTQKAIERNLALPKFNHIQASVGKTIVSDKIEKVLKYTFTEKNLS